MRSPDAVEQAIAKATDAASKGRDRESRKLARYALSLGPDHPGALFRWALELSGEPELAKYYLRRAAALGWGDATFELQIACVLFDLGETDDALRLSQRAGRHVDDEFVYLPGLVGHTLATYLARQGRGSDALRVIRASLALAPGDAGLLRLEERLAGEDATPAFAP